MRAIWGSIPGTRWQSPCWVSSRRSAGFFGAGRHLGFCRPWCFLAIAMLLRNICVVMHEVHKEQKAVASLVDSQMSHVAVRLTSLLTSSMCFNQTCSRLDKLCHFRIFCGLRINLTRKDLKAIIPELCKRTADTPSDVLNSPREFSPRLLSKTRVALRRVEHGRTVSGNPVAADTESTPVVRVYLGLIATPRYFHY